MNKWSRLIGGILLISGTTIGAGMLALPISTGLAGFYPSMFLLIFFWAFMTLTALFMLEVNLWMDSRNTNLISMAKETLGRKGEILCWIVYLFLLYALTTAYIAGSGAIFIEVVEELTGRLLPSWLGSVPLLVVLGAFIYKGTRSADLLNRVLMMGMVLAYAILVIYLAPHVDHTKFSHMEWKPLLSAVSIAATAFGFHIIIPTLTQYVHRDILLLKVSIVIGGLIPLIVYISWQYLALGILPIEGEHSIAAAHSTGANGAHQICHLLQNCMIGTLARSFSFFAIVTSFLGVALSLNDFLADGLKIEKRGSKKWLLFLMTFAPPLVVTLIDPRAFLSALEYAGAFGVIVLLGLMPALMVWAGRYHHHYYSSYRAPGGRLGLIFVVLISLAFISIEIANKSGLLTLF